MGSTTVTYGAMSIHLRWRTNRIAGFKGERMARFLESAQCGMCAVCSHPHLPRVVSFFGFVMQSRMKTHIVAALARSSGFAVILTRCVVGKD
jgi:hypothetical protein